MKYRYLFYAIETILFLIIFYKSTIMFKYKKVKKYSLMIYHYMYENILNYMSYKNNNNLIACESIYKYIDKKSPLGFDAISTNVIFIGEIAPTKSLLGDVYIMNKLYIASRFTFDDMVKCIGKEFTIADLTKICICLSLDNNKDINITIDDKNFEGFSSGMFNRITKLYYTAFKGIISGCKMKHNFIKILCIPYGYKPEEKHE